MLSLQLVPKRSYTITRYPTDLPNPYDENGKYIEPTPTTINIQATVQPMTPNQVLQMPEGDRTQSWCKGYTDVLVRTKREGVDGYKADTFVWNGDTYEIRKVDVWDVGVVDHYKFYAIRVSLTS